MATKRLISVETARVRWNSKTRNERQVILNKIKNQIHSKDANESGYYYGNLYPKTQQAIQRYFS